MNPRLDGKVAFISGGGGGIGHAASLAFAAAGARIAVCDLDAARCERTAGAVVEAGGEAIALPTDITDDTQVAAAVAKAVARFGRLDILYNCAGGTVPQDGTVTDVPLDVFDRTFNLDVRGTFLCCRHGVPEMIRAGGGAIINMSSGAALRGASPFHVYSAAKGAILSLTRALAGTYAKQGIRANVIASGRVMTDRIIRTFGALDDQAKHNDPQDPLGRLRDYPFWVGDPEHIAATALFLASDASRMITGATIQADGGRSAY
ncbi:SDR family NAD(P)-dependent oxidoreductase [Falsiroseomonas sp.]|uniref:SDR family NAD(P)-dependent oxidoreductase n=1 Tax=Falsiroseomonas sp. TaxID=2870721 RepID=UPI002718C0E8|nr:SDR family oxidoreductase [Falsiroseomonas sp.]MDO9498686.1 SDR family oxidoreductase [Falsiroseomonas sp.]